MERLPIFVYGTLRPGQGNWGLLAGRVSPPDAAVLTGHAIYATPMAGFPYAAVRRGTRVVGELVEPRPGDYDEVLRDLDHLEGYWPDRDFCHYIRTAVTVRLSGGERRRSWVYLAGPAAGARLDDQHRIPGGDWVRTRRCA